MQIRRACSRHYYCLRETVIAEKTKLSLVSRCHLVFAILNENQLVIIYDRRPEPKHLRTLVSVERPISFSCRRFVSWVCSNVSNVESSETSKQSEAWPLGQRRTPRLHEPIATWDFNQI